MPARASWKGFLKLSLVSIPVKAFSATASDSSEVRLNQLHAECHSRIQYKKNCPLHGEVPADQIVSGYEYAKGQYVVVDTEELDKLRTEDEKAINLKEFISPDALDSTYFNRTYYLAPDGPVGQRPYVLLQRGMEDQKRCAIGQVVMHGKEHVILLRPLEGLLAMTTLHYEHQVTKPSAFSEEVPKLDVAQEEVKLIKALIDASTAKEFHFEQYKDVYMDKLSQLIEAKVAGKEIVAPPVQEQAQIINLMDALKQSVEKMQQTQTEPAGKPEKKMAPSKKVQAPRERKKKSS